MSNEDDGVNVDDEEVQAPSTQNESNEEQDDSGSEDTTNKKRVGGLKKSAKIKKTRAPPKRTPAAEGEEKVKPKGRSVRAGIIFPVARTEKILRKYAFGKEDSGRVSGDAAVFMASAVNYLAIEVFETIILNEAARRVLAKPKNVTDIDWKKCEHKKDQHNFRIKPKDIYHMFKTDEEFSKMSDDIIMEDSGKLQLSKSEIKEYYKVDKRKRKRSSRKKKTTESKEESEAESSENEKEQETDETPAKKTRAPPKRNVPKPEKSSKKKTKKEKPEKKATERRGKKKN